MKNHTKIFTITAILFCSLSSFKLKAQTREDSIINIKKIIKSFSSESVGYGLAASKSWYAYIYLHHTLSNEELANLTFDKTAEIRVYAFMALTYNKYTDLEKIKIRLLNDEEEVFTMQGCLGGEEKVKSIIAGIQNWNFDNAVARTLKLFDKDVEYRNKIYDDLLNERPIIRKYN